MSQLPFFKNDHIFNQAVRLLVKESHAVFSSILRNDPDLTRADVVDISRRYRSIIHECVDNLNRDFTRDNSEQINTFHQLEILWNLCEILLIDVSQTGVLVIQLLNWIKMHYDDLSNPQKEILAALETNTYKCSEVDSQDDYWTLLVKLVLRGEITKAIKLLQTHHGFQHNNQMQQVARMLEAMPFSNQFIVHEFSNRWVNWADWCTRERATGQFDNHPALLTIVRILSQDQEVYKDLVTFCTSWNQLMVAQLLYTDPCIKQTDIPRLCRQCITWFKCNNPNITPISSDPDEFDEIVISAFEYDLLQVIASSCGYFDDNRWFVTHFVDLLHSCDQLKIHEIVETDRLRETFLQDYASTLFDDERLWPIGVAYLDSCPTSGQFFLETLLSRVPLSIDDDVRTNKLIALAKKRGMTVLAKSICVTMARKWLTLTPRIDNDVPNVAPAKKNDPRVLSPVNLSNVLYWAMKSKDPAITSYISDQYLYYYCKTNTFPDTSVFDMLRRSVIYDERLAFLAKYFEFRQKVEKVENPEEVLQAGELARALLASKIYPRFFCQKLLDDIKDLIERYPNLVFAPDKTLDIMSSVEEISRNGQMESDLELRIGLVRKMAQALITPTNCDK